MDARELADTVLSLLVSSEGPALMQSVAAKAKALRDSERASLKALLTDFANDL